MKKNVLTGFAFLFFAGYLFTQPAGDIDSLRKAMEKCRNDSCRCKNLLLMGDTYESTFPDSAIYFYYLSLKRAMAASLKSAAAKAHQYIGIVHYNQGNYDAAEDQYMKAVSLFRESEDQDGIAGCYNNLGLVYSDKGAFDMAKEYYLKSLSIHLSMYAQCNGADCYREKTGITNALTNISLVYLHQGNDLKAIEYQLKALVLKEAMLKECKNEMQCSALKKGIARSYNNVGIIHYNQKSFTKAIQYYNNALKYYRETNEKYGISYIYGNFGNIYSDMALIAKNPVEKSRLHNLSLDYYNKSRTIAEELNDLGSLSSCYNNIGTVYTDMRRYDDAIAAYKKANGLYEQTGNAEGMAICCWNICELYVNLADSTALSSGQANEYLKTAVAYGEKAYEMSLEINTLPTRNGAALALMNAYKKLGQFEKSVYYAEMFISTRDSVFNNEHSRSLAELSTQYETDKKEKENQLLRLDQALQQAAIKRQYIVSVSVSCVLLLMLFLAYILYRSNIRRKKLNMLLSRQNAEIQQKNEEIMTQRDEIASQRDMVTWQKEEIEAIHEELTSSIRYAQKIQQAMLPSADILIEAGLSHFTLFKPRDIVSGDFYWATRSSRTVVVAVADCTGHGVPGAFMSMLGITLLNEIIVTEQITQPDLILNRLRTGVMSALQQGSGGQRDGMDIALCTLNLNTLELQFAGANNPLYIVHSLQSTVNSQQSTVNSPQSNEDCRLPTADCGLETADCQLIEQKGDKMPIGIHERMDNFTLHTMQLNKGDCIYLFSDGIADQFGGAKGKKLKYKLLKEILEKNSPLHMEEQKEKAEAFFSEWKGAMEQIDDVTLMGIKI